MEVGDVNGDGTFDLVFVERSSDNRASVVLGNGDGTFARPVTYDFGVRSYDTFTLVDFGGDGLSDLAATDRNDGVIVHMNTGGWGPPPSLRITDASVAEGNSGTTSMSFTVTLTHAATEPVTVRYTTAHGTAGVGDYQAATGTLSFAPGETEKTLTVSVNGDRVGEENESFLVNLSGATNATILDSQGIGTILDDEPRIKIRDVVKKEGRSGTTLFVLTVRLSATCEVPVTVAYATGDGTATGGSDYQATAGTLIIREGRTTGTIAVPVSGDRFPEPNETFACILSAATNGLILDGQATGTILDDEPRISITDVTRAERRRGHLTAFTFTITLSAAYDRPVKVLFHTVKGLARAGEDYIVRLGTLTFAPGQTRKTISVMVKGDARRESDETFFVDLTGITDNMWFTKSRAIGTILNDD